MSAGRHDGGSHGANGSDADSGRESPGPMAEGAWLAALAELPAMWPARLAAVLGLFRGKGGDPAPLPARSPSEAWFWLRSGAGLTDQRVVRRCQPDPKAVLVEWLRAAATADPARRWMAYRAAGVNLHALGQPGYPEALSKDHAAPYLLASAGALGGMDGPRVAIVGTRRCTAAGRETAMLFGRELAEANVSVVSGLALGIDGSAHTGALSASRGAGADLAQADVAGAGVARLGGAPVGVVAGGLDRPYPSRHRSLWRDIAARGVLMSEVPLGTPNEAWRFPARNRILAALADVVVIVESHSGGGSMITADEALARGRPVLVVPGSVRSPASVGTNRLLSEGAPPACDTNDILTALGLVELGSGRVLGRAVAPVQPRLPLRAEDNRPEQSEAAAEVLAAVDWAPTSTESVVARTGLAPAQVATALALLEMDRWVRGGNGWWERRGP